MNLDWEIRFLMQKFADAQEAIEELLPHTKVTGGDDLLITGVDELQGAPDFFVSASGLIKLCEQTQELALERLRDLGLPIDFSGAAAPGELTLPPKEQQ